MKKSTLILKIKKEMKVREEYIASECHICPKQIYKEITGQNICRGNCAMEAAKMLDILRMDRPPRTIINGAVDCGRFYSWFLEQEIISRRIKI